MLILWVGHIELRRYRGGKNLPNKSDEADALAMAAYAVDQENYLESGELNPRQFLMHRPVPINQLRELVQQLEHLNRVQSPIINYTRQSLAWQFPEKALSKTESTKSGNVPPLWGWLAQRESQVHPPSYKSITKNYQKSIAVQLGLEIDPIVRLHADWLCDIDIEEQRLEDELRLGMGTVLEQSGDKLVEVGSGSALCRMTFWQYVITKIEIDNRLPDNPIANEISLYKETLKSKVDGSGKQLLNGKHLQNKLMSKVANILFRELCSAIAQSVQ